MVCPGDGAWTAHRRGLGEATRVGNRLDCRLYRPTVAYFRRHSGARFASGELAWVAGVSASIDAGKAARRPGMPPGTLSDVAPPDLTVDGADEAGSRPNLAKELGRAPPRRMAAQGSTCLRVIVDDTKIASRLAEPVRLPVEVVPLECDGHWRWLEARGGSGDRRHAKWRGP